MRHHSVCLMMLCIYMYIIHKGVAYAFTKSGGYLSPEEASEWVIAATKDSANSSGGSSAAAAAIAIAPGGGAAADMPNRPQRIYGMAIPGQ